MTAFAHISTARTRDVLLAGILVYLTVQAVMPAIGARAQDGNSEPRVALASAFTYQGRLVLDGVPGHGPFDFEFAVYDSADAGAGTPLGAGILQVEDVDVENGLFSAQLNFGPGAFNGEKRWLEVRVRPGGSTSSFTVLGRNELTATPYALYATSAPWSGISGVPADLADGDNDTTYSVASPLALDDTTLGFSVAGCQQGDTWVFDGASWSCEPNEAAFGDITAVSAGPGLFGGATSGDATLSVLFSGTGTSPAVARSDHDHLGQTWLGPAAHGLRIFNTSANGMGLEVSAPSTAVAGHGTLGVHGSSFAGTGVRGSSSSCLLAGRPEPAGVHGCSSGATSAGVAGNSMVGPAGVGLGVYGSAGSYAPVVPVLTGVYGYANGAGVGVYGLTDSNNSVAVKGRVLPGTSGALSGHFLGAPVQMDNGCVGCGAPSDARLKRDIAASQYGLDAIRALEPVSFVYTPEAYGTETRLGFIAQAVRGVVPEVVHESEDGYLQVDYNGLIPVLVNAIKEQQAEIEALKSGADRPRATLPGGAGWGVVGVIGIVIGSGLWRGTFRRVP